MPGTIQPVFVKTITVEPLSAIVPVTRVANADSPAVPGVETTAGEGQAQLQFAASDIGALSLLRFIVDGDAVVHKNLGGADTARMKENHQISRPPCNWGRFQPVSLLRGEAAF